jgi:hypothetical protein
MKLPEITIANQSLLKTWFRNASQVDVFSMVFSAVPSMARRALHHGEFLKLLERLSRNNLPYLTPRTENSGPPFSFPKLGCEIFLFRGGDAEIRRLAQFV